MGKQLNCNRGTCRFHTENSTQFKIHKTLCLQKDSRLRNVKKAPLKSKEKTKTQKKLLSEEQYLTDFQFCTLDAKYTYLFEHDLIIFDREKSILENDNAVDHALHMTIQDYNSKKLKEVRARLLELDEIFLIEMLGEEWGSGAGTTGKSHNQYQLVKNRHFLKLDDERNGNEDVSFFSVLHFT